MFVDEMVSRVHRDYQGDDGSYNTYTLGVCVCVCVCVCIYMYEWWYITRHNHVGTEGTTV